MSEPKKEVRPKSNYNDENEPSSANNSGSDSEGVGPNNNNNNNNNGDSSSAESASESDSEFDEVDVDRKRKFCVKRLVELEKQFAEMKERLYSEKMLSFDNQLQQVKEEISPEYNKRLAALQESHQTSDKILDLEKEFQLNELQMFFDSEMKAAQMDFENDKRVLFDKLKSDVENSILELQNEKRNADLNFELWQRENRRQSGGGGNSANSTSSRISTNFSDSTNFGTNSSLKRAGSPNSSPNEKRRKPVTVSGPFIVYMLKASEIQEDWNAIQRAIVQAELRDKKQF